jgi:hypothetical protein
MTSPAAPLTGQPTCACGCGTVLRSPDSKWARGHFHRGEGTYAPLPDPGDPPDLEAMFPDPAEFGPSEWLDEAGVPRLPEELDPDPEPASLRGDRPATRTQAGTVKASVRRDIVAKLRFALGLPGEVWKIRDPVCGGRFVEQTPAMADAWADFIIDSPDLLDWFTGPAGGFMKVVKIAAATYPVAEVVLTNHVFGHGHGEREDQAAAPEPNLSRYAA